MRDAMNTKEDEMKIAVSADTKEDKLDGLYEGYYKDGRLSYRCNYQAGKLEGLSEEYYKDGKLRSRYNYQAGELDGLYEDFYEDGRLSYRCNYQAGEPEGPSEVYYKDGKLSYRCNYKAGGRNSKVYTNFETFVRSLSNLEQIQLLREATSVNDKETCKLITEILKQKSDTEKENAGNKTN